MGTRNLSLVSGGDWLRHRSPHGTLVRWAIPDVTNHTFGLTARSLPFLSLFDRKEKEREELAVLRPKVSSPAHQWSPHRLRGVIR